MRKQLLPGKCTRTLRLLFRQQAQKAPRALGILMLLITLTCFKSKADDYDRMRAKYVVQTTGGPTIDTTDATIRSMITSINANIATDQGLIVASPTNGVFSDLLGFSQSSQGNLDASLTRLDAMAKAYATVSISPYHNYNNATLGAQIATALDFITTHWYSSAYSNDNFYPWMITRPRTINDILMLTYAAFSTTQIQHAYNSLTYFIPTSSITGTGGWQGYNMTNMVRNLWNINVLYKRTGQFTPTNTMLQLLATQSFYPVDQQNQSAAISSGELPIEGYASDGSFTSHRGTAYVNGTYGIGEMQALGSVVDMISQSTAFFINTDTVINFYKRVFDTYQHLCYNGYSMPMVSGRFITHNGETSGSDGIALIASVISISQDAPTSASWGNNFMGDAAYPANPKQAMLNLAKYWLTANGATYTPASIPDYIQYKAFQAGTYSAPASQVGHFNYPWMGKDSHITANWASGISMYSSRNRNWESDGLGLKNWHVSDGMTYLFNTDQAQYDGNYWPTVNWFTLAGITSVVGSKTPQGTKSPEAWVGGVRMQSMGYGTAGMSVNITDSSANTLTGRKSWFSFDSEIVCLGAGIAVNTAVPVETYVEQRKLNSTGTNAFSINGTAQSTSVGSAITSTGVTWAYLTGSVAGADIGYYFPTATTLYSQRTKNTGSWAQIDYGASAASVSNYFQTIWFKHGTHPTSSSYAYAILPNKTSAQVSSYATTPDFFVVRNDDTVQAVKKNSTNTIGVNFWKNETDSINIGTHPGFIVCNKEASIMLHQTSTSVEIDISDPTQTYTGDIFVEVKLEMPYFISEDPAIHVHQYGATEWIQFNLAASGLLGKTQRVVFGTTPTGEVPAVQMLKPDSAKAVTDTAATNKPTPTILYPNPATGTFTLAYYSTAVQPGKLTIYDMNGVAKQSQDVALVKGQNNVAVGIAHLVNGIYYVVFTNAKETVKRQLIVSQ